MKKRIFSVILAMAVVMSMLTVAGFSASAATDDKVISFDVKSAGWTNIKAVYCHIYNYLGNDSEKYTEWQTKKEKCDYNAETGVATFDLQTAIDEGFSGLETISGYNKWCVVFSCNTGEQTAPLVFSSRCFGDTVVAEPNTILESEYSADKIMIKASYIKNTHLTTPKCITYSGKIQGETYINETDNMSVLGLYIAKNVFKTDRVNKNKVVKLANELDTDLMFALNFAAGWIYTDENLGYTEAQQEQAMEIIRNIIEEVSPDYQFTDDYVYEIKSDNTVQIWGYLAEDANVVIPSTIDGYKVSAICADAFFGSEIESVVIPDGVKRIGLGAFIGCEKLKSVVIPESVTKIEMMAFAGCPSLEAVKLPSGIKRIESGTFLECTSLTSIEIPENVKEIASLAFYHCPKLMSVTIPESVVEIGEYSLGYIEQEEEGTMALEGFKIVGKNASEARLYALDNGIEFISNDAEELTLGDVNGDGKVDVDDATELQKYLAEQQTLTEEQQKAADFNGENGLTVDDVTAIQKYLAGIYDITPPTPPTPPEPPTPPVIEKDPIIAEAEAMLANDPYAKEKLEIFTLTNKAREEAGVKKLRYSSSVNEIAQIRANEITEVFSHQRPNGTSWDTIIAEHKLDSNRYWGENIGMGFSSPEQLFGAWMNSSAHRDNILSPDYTEFAVGYAYSDGKPYFVQMFKS